MPNNYYNQGTTFTPGTTARSADVNTELSGVETGFDFLPTVITSLHRNTTAFATETGSGNAFVIAMSNIRTVNSDGDEVSFYATHGNSGNSTLAVDSIGAVSIRDHVGAQLASGAIVSGRFYTVRYDNANGYFVLSTTFGTFVQQSTVVGTSTDNPTAPGTFNALLAWENANNDSLGDVGYNVDTHLTIKNRVHGGNVKLAGQNGAGTDFEMVNAIPGGNVEMRAGSNIVFDVGSSTGAARVVIRGSIVVATPPTNESVTCMLEFKDSDVTDVLGHVGYLNGNDLIIDNAMRGGKIRVNARDTAGVLQVLADINPDGPEKALAVIEKIKPSVQSRNTSITLTDDAFLHTWNLDDDTRYIIEGFIHGTQNVGNIAMAFDFSDTPQVPSAISYNAIDDAGAVEAAHFADLTTPFEPTGMTDTSEFGIHFIGYFRSNVTTGGTMDFQWAQETSDGNDTTVREGSWIRISKEG